jgi:hypothetical protein
VGDDEICRVQACLDGSAGEPRSGVCDTRNVDHLAKRCCDGGGLGRTVIGGSVIGRASPILRRGERVESGIECRRIVG